MCERCGEQDARLRYRGTDRLYATTSEQFAVVECRGCGLLRLDPQPAPDELARYYPPAYWYAPDGNAAGRGEELYRAIVIRDHVAFVRRAIAAAGPGPVVDVGCGGGLFLRSLRAGHAFGFDNSLDAAHTALHRNGVPAICGDFTRAPLPAGSCAVITMFHVLEHLHDPGAFLSAARALLTRDGRLVIQVPNASCWQRKLFGARWNGLDIPRHLWDFRQGDIEALLVRSGFDITRRKHFSLRDNPPGLATTLAPALDPMSRRVRGVREPTAMRLAKDVAYLALTVAALPFTIAEAAFGAGSSIMIEARRTA